MTRYEHPTITVGPRPSRLQAATFLLALGASLWPMALSGQDSPLVLELHGGAANPVDPFRRDLPSVDDPSTGFEYGARLALRTGGLVSLYAGFSQLRFGCGSAACPGDDDLISTGWELGLRLSGSVFGVEPLIQVGPVFTKVEAVTGRSPEAATEISDLAFGGEVGIGLAIPVATRVAVRPMVRFQAINAQLPQSGFFRLRHAVFELGLGFGF